MRHDWLLRVLWGPHDVHGQVIQWWDIALDSARDAHRHPSVPESRVSHGRASSVMEAGRIRVCVMWTASGEMARAVASAVDSAAWRRAIWPPRPNQPTVHYVARTKRDASDVGAGVDSIYTVRVDTIYLTSHARRVNVERREGSVYRFDYYSEFTGPSPVVDEWMTVLGNVERIVRSRR